MKQSLQGILLGLVLLFGNLACAPKIIGPTVPSGHFYSVRISSSIIWLLLPNSSLAERFPRVAELSVQVQDAQGQPVNGVPVAFQIEASWAHNASITPARVVTQDGSARAILEPQTTGVVHVMVQVENITERVAVTVSSSPSSGSPGGP